MPSGHLSSLPPSWASDSHRFRTSPPGAGQDVPELRERRLDGTPFVYLWLDAIHPTPRASSDSSASSLSRSTTTWQDPTHAAWPEAHPPASSTTDNSGRQRRSPQHSNDNRAHTPITTSRDIIRRELKVAENSGCTTRIGGDRYVHHGLSKRVTPASCDRGAASRTISLSGPSNRRTLQEQRTMTKGRLKHCRTFRVRHLQGKFGETA